MRRRLHRHRDRHGGSGGGAARAARRHGREMPWSGLGNVARSPPPTTSPLRRGARLGVASRRPGEHRRVVRARLRAQLVGGARARPAPGARSPRARQHPQGGGRPRRGRGNARPSRRRVGRCRREGLTWTVRLTAPGRGWVVLGAGGHARSSSTCSSGPVTPSSPSRVRPPAALARRGARGRRAAFALLEGGGLHACVAVGANAAGPDSSRTCWLAVSACHRSSRARRPSRPAPASGRAPSCSSTPTSAPRAASQTLSSSTRQPSSSTTASWGRGPRRSRRRAARRRHRRRRHARRQRGPGTAGCRRGARVTIGSGAVVTAPVGDGQTVVGVPATRRGGSA